MGYPPFSFEKRVKRFWQKVKMAGPDDCWLWAGAKTAAGYGQVWINSKWDLAHRFCWEITNGLIPPKEEVCHRCDTRACVNPKHLFLGPHFVNMDDCFSKGRMAVRERHPSAKLNWDAVNHIRANPLLSQRALAKKYGVSQSLISDVRHNKIWRTDGERSPKTRR